MSSVEPKNVRSTGSTRTISSRSQPQQKSPFTGKCISCNGDASADYEGMERRKGPDRVREVACVRRSTTRASISRMCESRKDYEDDLVYARIGNVPDLVQVQARYHCDCQPKFFNHRFVDEDGTPLDSNLDNATKYAIRYIIENDDDCQLSDKAHDRAMRGHKLVMISIATLILKEIEWNPEEITFLNDFLDNLENPEYDIIAILNSAMIQNITKKFLVIREKLKQRSPTAGL
ncbi:hypothetical protein QAD02_020884 [Eretmocerus hayati]|uniref:Uncharacterized protein n=1 Tax=Eretmocerus hayati TaxID=131215 RepID=A0ACC2PQL1_9HYME|nr:hypothetical protein QAD02_020884 [Eretmocerus hayati]